MPIPGPFAPTVTQYAWDRETETLGAGRPVTTLAEYPGGTGSGRATSTEVDNVVTADLVLLLTAETTCSEYDEWLATDGHRYRAQGAPSRYLNPSTGTALTQVNLRRIT